MGQGKKVARKGKSVRILGVLKLERMAFLIFLLLAGNCWAEQNDVLIALRVAKEKGLTPYQTKLLLAIRAVENGREGKEYGVLSIKTKSQREQAEITANSIKNNWKRWEKAGRPGDPIEFMAKRWAPVGVENDPQGLNKYWVRNVKYFMEIME